MSLRKTDQSLIWPMGCGLSTPELSEEISLLLNVFNVLGTWTQNNLGNSQLIVIQRKEDLNSVMGSHSDLSVYHLGSIELRVTLASERDFAAYFPWEFWTRGQEWESRTEIWP